MRNKQSSPPTPPKRTQKTKTKKKHERRNCPGEPTCGQCCFRSQTLATLSPCPDRLWFYTVVQGLCRPRAIYISKKTYSCSLPWGKQYRNLCKNVFSEPSTLLQSSSLSSVNVQCASFSPYSLHLLSMYVCIKITFVLFCSFKKY